jgi:hypothetical protein
VNNYLFDKGVGPADSLCPPFIPAETWWTTAYDALLAAPDAYRVWNAIPEDRKRAILKYAEALGQARGLLAETLTGREGVRDAEYRVAIVWATGILATDSRFLDKPLIPPFPWEPGVHA